MDATQTAMSIAVGGLVMSVTQALKPWTPEGQAPLVSLILTFILSTLWIVSQPDLPGRTDAFAVAAEITATYLAARGIHAIATVETHKRGPGRSRRPVQRPGRSRRHKRAPQASQVIVSPPATIGGV